MGEYQEVLLGRWETNNDGGIHILYGSVIEFEVDGVGTIYGWGGSNDQDNPDDPKYEYKKRIMWSRIDNKTIQIKQIGDEAWTLLEYVISEIQGPYNVQYEKIVSTNFRFDSDLIKEWFWNIPEALYRQK